MLAACQKDDAGSVTTVNLFAEGFVGNTESKLDIDGTGSTWNSSDNVRINDVGRCNISVSNGQASVSGSFTTPLRAVSPASLCDVDLITDEVELSLPTSYTYTRYGVSDNQHLPSPMAAYAASGSNLQFKHLTGALTVNVTNSTGANIYLESITVSSNKYQLAGLLSIRFSELENISIDPVETTDASLRSVTMTFSSSHRMVASNGVLKVQIPVLPVGDDNCFTITVKYRNYGENYLNDKHCYTFSRTQTAKPDNGLARAQLGYVPVTAATSGDYIEKDYFFTRADGYYIISDRNQFRTLANVCANLENAKIAITDDFSMSGYPITPISNILALDGGGRTISNLTVNTDANPDVNGNYHCGLLSRPSGSNPTVANLTLKNPTLNVSSSAKYVGTFVSLASGISFSNCKITGTLTVNLQADNDKDVSIGGIVGDITDARPTSFSNCSVADIKFKYNNNDFTNTLSCGGLIGRNSNSRPVDSCSISNCSVNISKADNYVQSGGNTWFGGLIGYSQSDPHHLKIRNNTVSISNLKVTSTSVYYTTSAGAWVGGVQPDPASGFDSKGNSTEGQIEAYHSDVEKIQIGRSDTKHVCGNRPNSGPSTINEANSTRLNLTITANAL